MIMMNEISFEFHICYHSKDSLKVAPEGEESADVSIQSQSSMDDASNLNELPLVGFKEDVDVEAVFEKTGLSQNRYLFNILIKIPNF